MKKSVGLLFLLLLAVTSCSKKTEGWEMVIHAQEGEINSGRLTLTGVSEKVVLFTKQTPRKVRVADLQDVVNLWQDLFAKSNPNAVLSVQDAEGRVANRAIVLKTPSVHGDTLIIDISAIDISEEGGNNKIKGSNAVLYIDVSWPCGPPCWPIFHP